VRVLVTGGRGTLGRRVVEQLKAGGHDPVAASRSSAVTLDLTTGAGLQAAIEGAEAIVHCASNPRGRDAREVEVEGTARLIAAASRARTAHLIYISIVGVDRVPYSYYEYKLHAEKVVEHGGVPWSILRTTQFFPFVASLLTAPPVLLAPRGFLLQPVATHEVAALLVRAVDEGPRGRLPDLGGPAIREVAGLARTLRAALCLRRPVLRPWLPGRLAASIREGALTAPRGERGSRTWEEWLAGGRR
jgi:uncharacterized protein YbjT (DUF2867 family)